MPNLRDLLAPHHPTVKKNLVVLYTQRDELAQDIEQHEAFLALVGDVEATPPKPDEGASVTNGATNGNGHANGHKRLTEKRAAVLAIMGERPGRWTPAELREALEQRGIDPNAGTPVKNILWHLAKAGEVHASGNGVYEFPALNFSLDGKEAS